MGHFCWELYSKIPEKMIHYSENYTPGEIDMINIRKLESELWESADLLRAGSKLTSNQYCMPVLGLIFLRYAYSRFKLVEAEILKDRPVRNGQVLPVEESDFASRSALFLPLEAQYAYLVDLPENISAAGLTNRNSQVMNSLGEVVNNAMELVEEQSEQLSGVLPKDYTMFSDELLAELLRIFNNSALDDVGGDVIGRIYEYFLNKFAKNMVGASGRQRVNNDVFTSIDISFPKIEIQRRIADILSAYDDLIENNRKQIKLLEEAAQRLYKEWFVDLRFPGYEHTKITDGVPEGWDIRAVSDFGKVITGKTPSTSKPEYYGGNIPFVTIPDMHNTIFPLSTEKYLSKQGANTQKNKFLPPHSVMVSCIATVGLVNITCDLSS